MFLKGILRRILSYRLKYNVEREYPWRWTTPVVLIVFAVVTAFLALLNISLAGQDIVQEFTAHPNDTSSDLPFSTFLPSLLRPSPGDFTPTTFKVGDILQTNMSFFEYKVIQAFDETGQPVLSFPWSNNPFSSCDVGEVHLYLPWGGRERALEALITCWFPSNITLSVSFHDIWKNGRFMARDPPWPLKFFREFSLSADLIVYSETKGPNNETITGWLNPCCLCSPNFPSTLEPHMQRTDIQLQTLGWSYKSVAHPACDDSVPARFIYYAYMPDDFSPSFLEASVHNILQVIYHLLRLDLGIMAPNQIFMSPEVFNKSMELRPSQEWIDAGLDPNDILAAPQFPLIPQDMQDTSLDVAVPKAVYLRPRFRPKPLPSAITSVFVATVTMVASLWQVFSLIAGFFVDSTLDDIDRTRSVEMMEEGDGSGVELLRATRRASD